MNARVQFHVTKSEHAAMMDLAREAGMGTSAWNQFYWYGRLHKIFHPKIVERLSQETNVEFVLHDSREECTVRFTRAGDDAKRAKTLLREDNTVLA